jgi:hypothetical protein
MKEIYDFQPTREEKEKRRIEIDSAHLTLFSMNETSPMDGCGELREREKTFERNLSI